LTQHLYNYNKEGTSYNIIYINTCSQHALSCDNNTYGIKGKLYYDIILYFKSLVLSQRNYINFMILKFT